jgi:CBS domain-containing protein
MSFRPSAPHGSCAEVSSDALLQCRMPRTPDVYFTPPQSFFMIENPPANRGRTKATTRAARIAGVGGNAVTVRDILSHKGSDVVTVSPAATLEDVVRILVQKHIGAVVVTDGDGHVLGILSERDIVRVAAEKGAALLATPVSEVMTRKVTTCEAGDTIGAIMELMTTGKFRHVPVLERGRLAGMISIRDVVEFRLEQVQRESESICDYIRSA